jgi:hypothetical protein
MSDSNGLKEIAAYVTLLPGDPGLELGDTLAEAIIKRQFSEDYLHLWRGGEGGVWVRVVRARHRFDGPSHLACRARAALYAVRKGKTDAVSAQTTKPRRAVLRGTGTTKVVR